LFTKQKNAFLLHFVGKYFFLQIYGLIDDCPNISFRYKDLSVNVSHLIKKIFKKNIRFFFSARLMDQKHFEK